MSRARASARQTRASSGVTLAVLILASAAYILLQSFVLPALPTMQRALHTSQSTIAWILTAYLLSASVATPVLGRLGDILGKKRILVAVLGLLGVGAVAAALTSSVSVMIAARVLQGAGGAVFPLAFSIIRDELPRERVPGAIGSISALIGVGAGVAIVLAGPIVDHLSFHWLFWIPAAMSAVAMVATILFVPESPVRSPGRVNVVAAAALSGWLVALLLGVTKSTTWGLAAPRTLALFVAAVVLFALWILIELRAADPLVDVRLMRTRAVWWTNATAGLLGFGMYAVMVAVPAFLQTPSSAGYGFSATIADAGFVLLPMSATMLVAGLATGRVTRLVGAKVPLVVGGCISAAGLLLLAVLHGAEWPFYLAMALNGCGIGLAFSALTNLIVAAVPAHQTGVATGMNANVRTIGGSVGTAVVSSVVTSSVAANGLPPEHAYVLAFLVLGLGFAAAAAIATLVPRPTRAIA